MTRAVFVACDAYNWDPTDPKNAYFSLEKGGARIAIDATRRPGGGVNVEAAIVDDHVGGATSVDAKGSVGALYIEESYSITHQFPLLPKGYDQYADRTYEFRTIQYSAKHARLPGRRYYGFHAIWIDGEAEHANLLIFNAGESRGAEHTSAIRRSINLRDDTMVLTPDDAGYRMPAQGDVAGGCIFLRCKEARTWKLSIPKLPQVLGGTQISCPNPG